MRKIFLLFFTICVVLIGIPLLHLNPELFIEYAEIPIVIEISRFSIFT